MEKLPDKTIIGAVDCPNCGAETPLKISDKGAFQAVYFHCMRGLEGGGQCRTSARFGQMSSAKMIGEYLINQPPKETATAEDETDHVQLQDREEEAGTGTAETAAGEAASGGQTRSSIFGSLREFFFEPEGEPAADGAE